MPNLIAQLDFTQTESSSTFFTEGTDNSSSDWTLYFENPEIGEGEASTSSTTETTSSTQVLIDKTSSDLPGSNPSELPQIAIYLFVIVIALILGVVLYIWRIRKISEISK